MICIFGISIVVFIGLVLAGLAVLAVVIALVCCCLAVFCGCGCCVGCSVFISRKMPWWPWRKPKHCPVPTDEPCGADSPLTSAPVPPHACPITYCKDPCAQLSKPPLRPCQCQHECDHVVVTINSDSLC